MSPRWLAALPLLSALVVATPGHAQDIPSAAATATSAAATNGAPFPMQYREAELSEIVTAFSERTGIRFVYDDRLRGRVTLTSPRPVRQDEGLGLLASALRIAGFALIPTASEAYQIVPLADSAGEVPFSTATPRAFVDSPVTTLVVLHAANAEALLATVQPLLGASAVVQAFAPTNTLILSATEAQLQRAILVIRALDRAEARQLLVLRPHFRDAAELLPAVQAAFPESRRASESLRIFTDARTNALIVEGPPDLVKEVREFLRTIDLPAQGQGGIQVVRLRHADAEDMAKVIQQAAAATPSSTRNINAPPGAESVGDALTGRDFALSVDKATNSLVIRSDAATFRVLGQLIATLDVDVPSVSVRVTLLEIEGSDTLDMAIDTLVPFTRPATPSEGTGIVRTRNSSDPSSLGALPTDGGKAFLLRFLSDPITVKRTNANGETVTETVSGYGVNVEAQATKGHTRLLSEPNILARSGEEQELFVGNNIPIISATQSSAAGNTAAGAGAVASADPLSISQNVQREDVGVRLRVEPTVPEEGPVRLELRIEYSALTAPVGGSVEAVGPSLIKQSVESTIYLADGAGAVVGVRGQPSQQETQTGTPWLMDVPGLGWLFRGTTLETLQKDLVLTVQVKVIHSPEDLELESIRRRVALERSVAGLERLPVSPGEAPFVVWVATTEDRVGAESIAAGLDLATLRAQVVPWKAGEPPRFDVYVTGFDRYADAMKTCLELQEQGYKPEVVALPGRP